MRSVYLPPWRVDVERGPGAGRVVPDVALARAIAAALRAVAAPSPASVGLILSDDAALAALNEEHLGHEGPTDVLSFPLLPPEAYQGSPIAAAAFPRPPGARLHLGDIVVSVERAVEQAVEGRGGQTGDLSWSPADELRLLVVHGTLHLCGWDHAEPADEAAMRALEQVVLAGLHQRVRGRPGTSSAAAS